MFRKMFIANYNNKIVHIQTYAYRDSYSSVMSYYSLHYWDPARTVNININFDIDQLSSIYKIHKIFYDGVGNLAEIYNFILNLNYHGLISTCIRHINKNIEQYEKHINCLPKDVRQFIGQKCI